MARLTEDGRPLGPCAREACRYRGWRQDDDGKFWCRRHDPFLAHGRQMVAERRRRRLTPLDSLDASD